MSLFERFVQRYGRQPTEFDKDYLEMLRMSKYTILDAPHYKPGNCANCGSTKVDGRKYIDFGLEIDWFGIVYICSLCMLDIAEKTGLFEVLEAKVKELQEKLDATVADQVKRESFVQRFDELLGEVKPYLAAELSAINDDSDSNGISSVESPEPEVVEAKPNAKQTNQRATKSTSGSRSENLPSLAELIAATPDK